MKNNVPIVLVHGLFGSLSAPEILQAFGETRVYAPDLIGYGERREESTDRLTLRDQSKLVAEFIADIGTKVHLVGHSIGGAVSALVATDHKELIATYTSVEGNFTCKDAFWSAQIAKMSNQEVEEIVQGYRSDPDAWIEAAGVTLNPFTSRLAREWLANQPSTTIRAQAKAVVEETAKPAYLANIQTLMKTGLPVNLIAGARSSSDWDTPEWANRSCTTRVNIPLVGHLMMAESVSSFASAVLMCTGYGLEVSDMGDAR